MRRISRPTRCEATQMPPHAAELGERLDEVVVAGVEGEAERDDRPGLVEVVVACLTALTAGTSRAQPRDAARASRLRTTRCGML